MGTRPGRARRLPAQRAAPDLLASVHLTDVGAAQELVKALTNEPRERI